MKLNVGVSARHVHLTQEDYNKLFYNNLEKEKELSVIGEFKSNKKVIIQTKDNKIENVAVLGPFRSYSQVEVSKTDAIKLKINPPVLNKIENENGEEITIIGDKGSITKNICIIAQRHIHINEEDYEKLKPNTMCKVKITTEKGGTIDNVFLKPSEIIKSELHVDCDDANAHLLNTNDEVEVLI